MIKLWNIQSTVLVFFLMMTLSQVSVGQCVNPAWSNTLYAGGAVVSYLGKDYTCVGAWAHYSAAAPDDAVGGGTFAWSLTNNPCDPAATAPVMTLTGSSAVTCSSADLTANISDIGGANVTVRGFIYGTTLVDVNGSFEGSLVGSSTKSEDAGSYGTGNYTINVTGLTSSVTYYIRAFSTNATGTTYATSTKSFFTCAVIPSLTTTAYSDLSCTSASSGGTVTVNGGDAVTAKGVCWSTASSPTIADSKTSDGAGLGLYTSSITGLTASTLYYVRAYATNGIGTAYGNEISFTTTVGCVTTYYSCATSNSWSLNMDCSSDDGTPGNTDNAILRHDWFDNAQAYSLPNLAWGQDGSDWFDAKPLKLTIQSGGRAVFNTTSYTGLPAAFNLSVDPGGIFASYTSLEVINALENNGSVHLFGAITNGNNITGVGDICYNGNFENSTLGGSINGAFLSANEATLIADFFTSPNAALDGICGSLGGLLPVELTSFGASKKQGFVEVEWTTNSEINSDYFDVESSSNAKDWELVDRVTGAGNSTTVNHYAVADWGINGYVKKYYRLKQVDYDSKFKFSEIDAVDFGTNGEVQTFMRGSSLVIALAGVTENITVQLFDIEGSLIKMTGISKLINENSTVVFDVAGESTGLYFVKAFYDNQQFSKKIYLNSIN